MATLKLEIVWPSGGGRTSSSSWYVFPLRTRMRELTVAVVPVLPGACDTTKGDEAFLPCAIA